MWGSPLIDGCGEVDGRESLPAAPSRASTPGRLLHLAPPPPSDRSLAERIRAGDSEAFSTLFQSTYPNLCALAARRVGSPEIAEELVQDVFLRIWERRQTLDPEQSVTRYLYRAARNAAMNHLKHRRVSERFQAQASPGVGSSRVTPEDHLGYAELLEAAQEAIEELPDRCREIFLLSRQSHLKYSEIAQLLGLSVKTVETQMGRALKALRTRLLPWL